jgi:hypothetical protein
MSTQTVSRRDLAIGTLLALIIGTIFVLVGGRPLVVTFVPGLVVAWGVFAWLHVSQTALPKGGTLYTLYYGVFAWQFIHFFEEYLTGFRSLFPELYGATPYSDALFVGINMFSYFVFAIGFILVFEKGLKFLLIPVLFYIVYGAIGNAIAHVWWVIWTGGYFPGFVTALAYWILGPLLLSRFVGSLGRAYAITAAFTIILIPAITLTMSPI